MEVSAVIHSNQKGIKRLAQAGFVAKGVVYVLLGALAFLAATETGGRATENADKTGVFMLLKDGFAGKWLLPILGAGLVCYTGWRMVEGYHQLSEEDGKKKWIGLRYFFSGAAYFSLAVTAFKMGFASSAGNGNSQQQLAAELLSKPFGQWLLGIAALIIAGIGCYQLYYALSEKYKKHVNDIRLSRTPSRVLLLSGKLGYSARGLVWLIIAFLMLRAALHVSSAEAGGTGKALTVLENQSYGPYLLALLGFGLFLYGCFNFVRARYEDFNQQLR